jgi:hypothetical protein
VHDDDALASLSMVAGSRTMRVFKASVGPEPVRGAHAPHDIQQ